ncbi:asparaginase [Mesosutterella sp. AGMB02718]|uniref:Asparaginase n=1 Tax=Mesosutterella faecium TaxID=2925194 RepID=A0ABT7IR76_9BURK|nr:asparaginase [Mesosutterella sp. AGMB02718]MDL2059811.1 asparaginase [Mesosutterella sp. AGMB02718]
MKPKILIIATGGTIVSSGSSPMQLTGYSIQGLGVEDVLGSIPGIDQVADIELLTLCSVSSSSITSGVWIDLARRIEQACSRPDLTGVVITHGTDTMEETAFFLNLVLKTDKPVVLTGAMRPATALSADGPLNLLNAIRVASCPLSAGRGVLVVLNGSIHGARDVTKAHPTAVETFQSRSAGPLGFVLGETVSYAMESTRPHTTGSLFSCGDFIDGRALPRVAVIYAHAEDDLFIPQAALQAGYQGLVHAGCGHGTISKAMEAELLRVIAKGMVVVRASRTGSGCVIEGMERWQKAGIIPSRDFSPQKARILLQLALNRFGPDLKRIDEIFRLF